MQPSAVYTFEIRLSLSTAHWEPAPPCGGSSLAPPTAEQRDLPVYPFSRETLGTFRFGVIVNNAGVNAYVQIFVLSTFSFL